MLVVGPGIHVPWLEYTIQAFKRLGHSAVPFHYSTPWLSRACSPNFAKKFAAVLGGPEVVTWVGTQWWRTRNTALVELARHVQPDLTVILRGELISDETLVEVKRVGRGALVTWWVDDPWLYPFSLERWRLYDQVFLFDYYYLRRLDTLGIGPVHFLPCACDETIYRPQTLSRREQHRYRSEIALVGWYYPNRAEVIRALSEFRVSVWGQGWASREARQALNGLGHHALHHRYVSDEFAAKIYSAATIGLNVHHTQSRDGGLNTRTFELLAAGTFELVDAIPRMEELLIPGEEIVAYHSPEEARALAAYYVRHPEARARMVARGRERVLREHTYVSRALKLLRVVGMS